jgi:uncharacterized protein YecE (DUF72 family)
MTSLLRLGTAGWTIPSQYALAFPSGGSALARYASIFSAVEINSTFRHQHMTKTFERWANSVPENFRFSVKFPRRISHELKLIGAKEELSAFLDDVAVLGAKLGPLLVQLPPSFVYDPQALAPFFRLLEPLPYRIVFEPRHESWFCSEAEAYLKDFNISRVAAHPAVSSSASHPGGATSVAYFRMHGAPRIYYSEYDLDFISELLHKVCSAASENVWCIFDNTASGAAVANAMVLRSLHQKTQT